MKYFFSQYKHFVMHLLAPLGGPLAILVLTVVDAAALGIPLDPVVAFYAYTDRRRILLYILLASIGSAVGSLVPYLIGYKGGEALVVKRIGRQRFARVHGHVERYGIWALIIPSMLPPPTPFKLFVFCAGVAEMSWIKLVASILVGRLMRFTILSVLTIRFGPHIVDVFHNIIFRHWEIALLVAAAAVLIIAVLALRRRSHIEEPVHVSESGVRD
ncbi:MAG: VTT domain-containing protein [Candidatus Korobacteraceae bacterium]